MATTTTTPAVGVKETKQAAKGPGREGNPAKAGWVTRVVLGIICFAWVVPTFGLFVTSFRTENDANTTGWWTVLGSLGNLTTSNYNKVLTDPSLDLGQAFINSVAIALPATFIPLLIAAFASYAFAFMRFPGRDILFLAIVSLLVVPNYVSFVPILKIYGNVGLGGTFAGVWLAHIGFGMSLAIYILRNYMVTLPPSVLESAKVDGASHFQTFYRLVLPMSVPALASFAIFQFLWVWNDLLIALVFIGPGENEPVTLALSSLKGQLGQGWEVVTAGTMLTMIVPIVVFLLLQRYFVRGMTAGAVKG
jgi:alpha-glucoside transport system permease protein